MLRAIELGKNALGSAAPNPMVGCCIVHEDSIIGEGFTSAYGGPHAEVNAIRSVKDQRLLEKATLYVTLEPCSHFGKTPPCSDLIIEKKIPKVVIGLEDPHTKVAGKGIEKLKAAGVHVVVGFLENHCREHHKRFLTFQEKKRPYVVLKWAESWDGFIAPSSEMRHKTPEPYWITNAYSKQLVHQWRAEEHAILVGTQTVLDDNPKLTVRDWEGSPPIRIILDRGLSIPKSAHVMDGSVKTIVLTDKEKNEKDSENLFFETVDFEMDIVIQICQTLYKHHILSVIIEGGAKTLQTFINTDVWDEARIFKGQSIFSTGIPAPKISGSILSETSMQNDTLTLLENDKKHNL